MNVNQIRGLYKLKFDEELLQCMARENLDVEQVKQQIQNESFIKKIHFGFCPCCEHETIFLSREYWLRDFYACIRCGSIPRQRALMKVLKEVRPNWRELHIHESSPAGVLLHKFKNECKNYTTSYFYEEKELGCPLGGDNCTNQNLEDLKFEDDIFDVFITQDVLEHVHHPKKVFSEIKRCLKSDGIHVFTVPLYPFLETRARVKIENTNISYLYPPIYHGNPISDKGSLVTYDWGHDIAKVIKDTSGMETDIHEFMQSEESSLYGLEADFLWVLVSKR